MKLVSFLIYGVILATTLASPVAAATRDKPWWEPDWNAIAGDPAAWTDATKARMTMVACTVGGALYLKASLAVAGGAGLLTFGLVALNWTAVVGVIFLYYAWVKRQKVLLAAGAWLVYCIVRGYSPLPF